MADQKDGRLNYNIYQQDSFGHRRHLLDILQRKTLTKQSSHKPVSYRPGGRTKFKVGFGGSIKELYASNPNTFLKEVLEEKLKKRSTQRKSMYKELVKNQKLRFEHVDA